MIRLSTGAICLLCFSAVALPLVRAQEPPHRSESARVKAKGSTGSVAAALNGVDAYVKQQMRDRHIPGVSVAVVKEGKLVLAKGYGLSNVELDVPATADTVYQLASVTKTFTAAAVMMLVQEGKLSLDDKITDRLADLPKAWEKVTVRQLLNHTSGIKSYTSLPGFDKTLRKDYTQRELIGLVSNHPLDFAPGEQWSYSNTGYFLLGMLIEKVSGKPYGEFMAERIFRPIGMTNTRVNDLRDIIPNRAQGYQWDGKVLKNGEYTSPTQPFSAGMLVSTVNDMVKWDAALADHTLLTESTQQRMWTPTRVAKGEAGYGFGWGISKVGEHRLVSHGGGIPGFSTEISRFVDDKLTVIVLTNADSGQAAILARGIASRYVPSLSEKAVGPIVDKDEATSKRLRGVIEASLKGEVNPDLFTDEAGKILVPRIKEMRSGLASLGDLKTFQLLERKESGQGARLRYRATFKNQTLNAHFVLDKAGKIEGVLLQPAE